MAPACNYERRKASVERSAALEMFTQDFATKAFEQCVRRPNVRSSDPEARPQLAHSLISFIAKEGREKLAVASLAYLLAGQSRFEEPEEQSFIALIEEIGAGATRISKAADKLAQQLERHYSETGEWEPARLRALVELAAALNADVLSHEELMPTHSSHPWAPPLRHGLSNCARLAHHAENFLARFRREAKFLRKENQKVLKMATGRHTDVDRELFVLDLAELYAAGMRRVPSAAPDKSLAPSPFVRFVNYVFNEVEKVADGLGIEMALNAPTAGPIRMILEDGRKKSCF